MSIFKKKCGYCGTSIDGGNEFVAEVKTPVRRGLKKKSFCNEEHAEKFKQERSGTARTNYCPSCGM